MKLYFISAILSKQSAGKTALILLQSQYWADSEAEARGLFIDKAMEENPEYLLNTALSAEVSSETIKEIKERYDNESPVTT